MHGLRLSTPAGSSDGNGGLRHPSIGAPRLRSALSMAAMGFGLVAITIVVGG